METASTAQAVAKIVDLVSSSDPNSRLGDILSEAFAGKPYEETTSLVEKKLHGLQAWREFIALCADAVGECKKCDEQTRDLALPFFERLLSAALEFGSDHAANQLTPRLDPNSIRLAAHMVTLARGETRLSLEEIALITRRLEDLIQLVTNSEIDSTLRKLLIAQLSRVRLAISVFQTRGPAGVESAANEATGVLVRALLGEPSRTDKARELLVQAIGMISEVTIQAQALGAHFVALPGVAQALKQLGS